MNTSTLLAVGALLAACGGGGSAAPDVTSSSIVGSNTAPPASATVLSVDRQAADAATAPTVQAMGFSARSGAPASTSPATAISMMGVAPGPGIFIDRLNGSDSNPGTFALPWKNLSKLLAARLTQGQSIYLACGATWRESIALSQTQLVSGITVTGYGPSCATAKPTISGADDLSSGWAKQGTVWSRRLPVGTPKVTRLFVNGVPLRTAQWPNFGGVGREYAAAQAASPVSSTALRQSTADAAALAGRDVVGATMRVRSTPWQIDTGVVLAYASDTITLAKATTYPMGAGNGYVLQDKLWMLDAAGEFFHDTASGTLYVYPPDTATQVDLNTALVEGSVRNTVLSVSGVSGITLRGLALIMSQGDGLSVMEAPGLVADQIDASHNGAAGIRVGLSVTPATGRGGTFKNSTMTDNWINGIYSWNAVNVDVIGNTIVDTGMLATAGGAMAAIMSGPGAVVNQNLIQRAGYHGIFYSGTGGSNITNNVIEGYCARLSDCAGIYTWNSATLAARNTLNQASLVQGNTVLTAAANMDGAQGGAGAEVVAGIYLDNLTSNAVVQSNMLYGMPTGIVLHNSSSNTVSGNRVWMTTSAGLWATMDHTEADLMTGNSVTGNQFAPASSASGTWPAIPALTTSKALSYWNRLTGSTPTSVGTNNFSRNEVVYLQGTVVGKSVLLGQMARSSTADVNVVVLCGERGREVREFIERELGPEGLRKSVVVVATSDEPALMRLRSAWLGAAIADYFRSAGNHVLLMMDSVTRFAMAQREIGLAAGEPPATRGYPPSVFSLLPKLLERSGLSDSGSVTGFYTVLVEGDDGNEPIADTVRGILDGHLVLSRKLAHAGHWPAIDVLASISRSMPDVTSPEHQRSAQALRRVLAAYRESQDLISIGAYRAGTNPLVDLAVTMAEPIRLFLQQDRDDKTGYDSTVGALMQLANAFV